jgi:hypothetical protein
MHWRKVRAVIYRRSFLLRAGALASASLLAEALPERSYDEPDEIYKALSSQSGTRVDLAGGIINVVFADGAPGLDKQAVLRWVRDCAGAISTYFGRYPTQAFGLLMVAGDRATGTTALRSLYGKFSSHGIDATLPVLFERLGVVPVQSQSVGFDPRAELAGLTRLITRP